MEDFFFRLDVPTGFVLVEVAFFLDVFFVAATFFDVFFGVSVFVFFRVADAFEVVSSSAVA